MKTKNKRRKLPEVHLVTESQCAAAFTEWERRYREEPERFMSEAVKLLRETPKSYGAFCDPYFLKIMSGFRAWLTR